MRAHRMHRRREHAHGAASIDYYACQSGIRHWNGCYKICFLLWALILCLILDSPGVSGFTVLIMGLLNLRGNGINFERYLQLLKIPAAFLILGSAAVILGISKEPAGDWCVSMHWFWLYVTKEGLNHALELFLKAMGAVSAMYVLALSTPASELAAVLQNMHVPKLLTELMYMIYRFIFILTEVHRAMKTAAVSRLGDVDFKTSCAVFGQIGGNLLILSLKRANTYYDAMVSRCYAGEFPFWEEEKPVQIWQVLAAFVYTAVLALLRLAEEMI